MSFFRSPLRALIATAVISSIASISQVSNTMAQSFDNTSAQRHVTVTASGSVSAVPDEVTISTGAQTTAKTARAALSANSEDMRRVIERLREVGIRGRDIATDDLSVQPVYERRTNNNREPRVTGYRVQNSVRIRVRDISLLGEVLDQVVDLGANQIGGIQFQVRRADKLRDEARTKAMENARRRAELFARAAGARLGDVLMIQEGSSGFNPRPMMMEMKRSSAGAVPVEAGSQELSANVTVTWALR